MESLGQAVLDLDVNLVPLDAGLAKAERRTAIAVATMQKMLDSLHGEIDMHMARALEAKLAADAAGAAITRGGGFSTVVERTSPSPTTERNEIWGIRGPVRPGSLQNPLVFVMEAAKYTPMGSYAAAVGESNVQDAQRGDTSSGIATAADMAALSAAVSDLARNVSPMSRLAQAGQEGLAEPALPGSERVTVALDDPATRALQDAAAILGRIESQARSSGGRTIIAPGPGAERGVRGGPSVVETNVSRRTAETTIIDSSKTVIQDRGGNTTVLPAGRSSATPAAAPVFFAWPGQGGGRGGSGVLPIAVGGAGGGGGRGVLPVVAGGGRGAGGPGLLAGLGWGTGFAGAAGFGSLLSFAGLDFAHLITTALGIAGSAGAGAVGGGLLGLGSLGKLAVGGGSDAAVMKSTIADTQTLAKDYQNLAQAQAVYGKNSTQAAQATAQLNFDMATLGNTAGVKAEAGLAKASQALNTFWDLQTSSARVQAVKILMQGIALGHEYVPLVAQAAQQNLSIINTGLKPLFAWLEGPQGVQIFHDLENAFATELPTAVHAFDQALELLLRVTDIASQYTGGFVTHLDHLFTRLNSMDNAQLGAVIQRYVNDFRLWDTFVKLLIEDVYGLFHQDVGTGNAIIATLNGMLERLHAYEQSATGSAQLQNIFMVHKTEVLDLIRILGILGGAFTHIYMAVAPGAVTVMNDVVLPVLDGIAGALKAIASISPLTADALGAMLILAKFGGIKAITGLWASLRTAIVGADIAAAGGAAATGGAAAAAGGGAAAAVRGLPAIESAGFSVGAFLAGRGAVGAGVSVANFGVTLAAGITSALRIAMPSIGALLATDFLLKVTGASSPTTVRVTPSTPAGQIKVPPLGFHSSAPLIGPVVNAFANLIGVNTGTTLEIKKIGDYSDYSLPRLKALLAALKPGITVKVNGVAQSEKQVRELVQTAVDMKENWNAAFNAAWNVANTGFFKNLSRSLPALVDDFHTALRKINSEIGLNSNAGLKLWADAIGKMVAATTAGMASGKIKVSQGLKEIDAILAQGLQAGAITWTQDWKDQFSTLTSLYQHHKIDTRTYLADLGSIMRQGYGQIRSETESSQQAMYSYLKQQENQGNLTHGEFLAKWHASQVAANIQSGADMADWVATIAAAMKATGQLTGQGMKIIAGDINNALGLFGAAKLSVPEAIAWSSAAAAGQTGVSGGHRATGATGMKVSTPSYVVGEEGAQHPEYVVATNPAYRQRNLGLWAAAGKDLGVPGFAQGGYTGHPTLNYAQLEGLWQAGGAGGNPALMAAIAMAESGGRDVVNSIGASGYWQIYGLPFAGDPLDPVTNSRMAHAKLVSQGLTAWVTYVTGAYKQFLQGGVPPAAAMALAQITAPKVGGKGALADIARAALNLDAKAANAHLAKISASSAGGGAAALLGAAFGGKGAHGAYSALRPERTDQGVDFGGSGPVGAVGAGRVLHTGLWPGWPGTGGIVYQIPQGNVYVMEDFSPMVGAGASITMDQLIGQATGGPSGIETGWANAAGTGPLTPYGGRADGTAMPGGLDFRSFIGYALGGLLGYGGKGRMSPAVKAMLSKASRPMPRAPKTKDTHLGSGSASSFNLGRWLFGRYYNPEPGAPGQSSLIGADGPFPFDPSDISPIASALEQISKLSGPDGTGGDAATAGQWISYYTSRWSLGATPNYSSLSNPSDFVVTTDASGNPVTPYIDTAALNMVLGEAGQILGYDQQIVGDVSGSLKLAQTLVPAIQRAVKRRNDLIAKIRKRIRENVAKIKALQAKIKAEQARKPPFPSPKTKAQSDANADFRTARTATIAHYNQQIAALHKENIQLGGSPDQIGNPYGGELGTLNAQVVNLDAALNGGAAGSGSSLLDALTGSTPGGVEGLIAAVTSPDGVLAVDQLAVTSQQDAITLLSQGVPGALTQAQGQAAGATGATSTVDSQLAALLQQQIQTAGEALAVSQLQYQALSELPPFGGSFATGGIVPGPVGAPRTVIAHGGEVIGRGGIIHETSLHFAPKDRWLRELIDLRVEHKTREMARKGGRGLPSRGGGQLLFSTT